MNKIKKYVLGLVTILTTLVLLLSFSKKTEAAPENNPYGTTNPFITVSVDKTEVAPGDTFTITITADANDCGSTWWTWAGYIYLSNYDHFTYGNVSFDSAWEGYLNLSSVRYEDWCDMQCIYIQIARDLNGTPVSTENNMVVSLPVTVNDDATCDEIKIIGYNDDFNEICVDDLVFFASVDFIFDCELETSVAVVAPSNDAVLEEAVVDGVAYNATSSPTLDAVLNDGIEVDASTTKVTFTPKAGDNGSISNVTSNGTLNNNGDGTYTVTLNDPGAETTITTTVLAQDKTTTEDFVLTINRKKYDYSALESLTVSLPSGVSGNMSMDKSFNKEVTDYTLSLPEGAKTLDLNLEYDTTKFIKSVTINGTSANNGTNNISIDGKTSVEVVVTAQDGTATTYTITLDRKSDNVELGSLNVYKLNGTTKGGEITLDANYQATIKFEDATGFEVSATLKDTKGSIEYDKQVSFGDKAYDKTTKSIEITVTSESGIVKVYTVSVTREKADENVNFTLTVKGEKTSTEYSKSASSTSSLWIYEIPASEVNAVVEITGLGEFTNSSGAGTYEIYSNVANDQTITITPQYASKEVKFTISIRKAKEVYNAIDTLELLTKKEGTTLIDKNNNSLVYDKDTTEYSFTVPYETTSLYVNATTKNGATLSGVGVFNLTNTGTTANKIEVYATSEAGVEGTKYTIEVYRTAADADNKLESLTVAGQAINLSNPTGNNYGKVVLPHDTTKVKVVATLPEDSKASIETDLSEDLAVTAGNSQDITVVVKAQSGALRYYIVTVVCKEQDNTITNIELSGITYIENTTQYSFDTNPNATIYVDYETNKITFNVSTNAKYATIYINDKVFTNGNSLELSVGDSNQFVICLKSELGENGDSYTIKVDRDEADEDNSLETLTVAGQTVDLTKHDGDNYGEIILAHDTTSVTVSATLPEGSSAEIQTDLSKPFTVKAGNSQDITITVEAQSGALKYYIVTVVCKETENEITNIALSGITYVENTTPYSFDTNPNATVYVTYKTERVTIDVSKLGTYSTIYVGGSLFTSGDSKSLNVGTNSISIYVKSEYGEKGTEYNITIERAKADDNNYLSGLEFNITENGQTTNLLEGFGKEETSYSIEISNKVTATTAVINATKESTLANIISGDGSVTLPTTSTTYQIIVEAENGDRKTYSITVMKEGADLPTNNEIIGISVQDDDGNEYLTGSQKFEQTKTTYNITLPYNVGSVSISATTPEGAGSTKFGEGTVSVAQGGKKTVEVYAVAGNGQKGTVYTITINRDEPEHDAYLTSLKVGDTEITLKENVFEYSLRVDVNITSVEISATAYGKGSVDGVGTVSLSMLNNNFTIKVTAQDGKTVQPYKLTICRAEDLNEITKINVSNSDYVFVKGDVNPDKIVIPYSDRLITITVEVADGNALYADVTGDGTHNLTAGTHNIEVYATSQFGTKGTVYNLTIEVSKPSNNNYLDKLEVLIDGTNMVEYDPNNPALLEKTSFTIENVDSKVQSVTINATAQDENAKVTGTGIINLNNAVLEGNTNILTVTVTAEDNSVREIKIYISRASVNLDDNNEITNITITGSNGIVYFNSFVAATTDYLDVTVPYSVSSITVTVSKPNGAQSTITGDGVYTFDVDYDVDFTVYATSVNGTPGTKYNFLITREQPGTNPSLEWIKIDGSIIEGFDGEKYEYDILVNYSVDSIHLSQKPVLDTTTIVVQLGGTVISGNSISLVAGTQNVISIIAKAEDGTTRVYNVKITRASADGSLSDLYLDGVNFHEKDDKNTVVKYDPATKVYYATVSYAVSTVLVCAQTTDTTVTIRGTGTIALSVGSQEIQVSAIPEFGNLTVYTIVVIRKAEANSSTAVKDFVINEIPGFKDIYRDEIDIYDETYNLTVGPEVTSLTFDILFDVADFEDAPTTSIAQNSLKFGQNVVYVTITATDQTTTRLIAINVRRLPVSITSISIAEIPEFTTDYKVDVTEYNYIVDAKVEKLTVDVLLSDECGTYTVSDTTLEKGKVNTITITLSVGDEVCNVITVNVLRGSVSSGSSSSGLPIWAIATVGALATITLLVSYFVFKKKKERSA